MPEPSSRRLSAAGPPVRLERGRRGRAADHGLRRGPCLIACAARRARSAPGFGGVCKVPRKGDDGVSFRRSKGLVSGHRRRRLAAFAAVHEDSVREAQRPAVMQVGRAASGPVGGCFRADSFSSSRISPDARRKTTRRRRSLASPPRNSQNSAVRPSLSVNSTPKRHLPPHPGA